MPLPLHRDPWDLPIDIVARSIDQDDLTPAQKVEINLPVADPEVLPLAKRWVAAADAQNVKSDALEQVVEMLSTRAGYDGKKRGGKIKPTPRLKRTLWDKLLSDDDD